MTSLLMTVRDYAQGAVLGWLVSVSCLALGFWLRGRVPK